MSWHIFLIYFLICNIVWFEAWKLYVKFQLLVKYNIEEYCMVKLYAIPTLRVKWNIVKKLVVETSFFYKWNR